jgi:prevent-host-death family protein
MRQVNVHEAKTQLSKLLEAVEGGEAVIIARAGVPIAVLKPYELPASSSRNLGAFAGQAVLRHDFDALPDDIQAAFSGIP